MHVIIGLILFFVLLVMVFDIDVAQKIYKAGFIIVGVFIGLILLYALASK